MKSKNIITAAAVLCASMAFNKVSAQVAIGKTDITNTSVLLEFGSEAKGIIVPQVSSAPGAVGGTFIFNSQDNALEVWEDKNNNNAGGWTNLTVNETAGVAHTFTNSGTTDVTGVNGAIIGAGTSTKPGALVLESTTKAMVLPQVANPHLTIPGAIAGTIVYDTAADMLAVYDGANWSYWK
ncbi:MAG: hypothetical protein QM564_05060 [Bergeyella sp.]